MSVLKQLEWQLGVHAVLIVTYKDTEGEVKISEYVPSKCRWPEPDILKVLSLRDLNKKMDFGPPTPIR